MTVLTGLEHGAVEYGVEYGAVHYDAQAMRTALTTLREIEAAMDRERAEVTGLEQAGHPGTAPVTAQFHQGFTGWAHELGAEHAATLGQVRSAIETLLAVDREYNNGELAAELGFSQVRRRS